MSSCCISLVKPRCSGSRNRLGELPEIGDDAVIAGAELAEGVGAVARDIGRSAEHGKPDAAFRLGLVIALVTPGRHAILAKADRMRGAHDPVAQLQMRQLKGLKQ